MFALNSLRNKLLTRQYRCICQSVNEFSLQCSNSVRSYNIRNDRSSSVNILAYVPKPSYLLTVKRFKFDPKKAKNRAEEEDDADDLSEWKADDYGVDKDSKVFRIKLGSMRADLIIKSALKIARNKIETLFYESKLRINGNKVMKKSLHVNEGDEIDVIKFVSPKNPAHIIVSRVEILEVKVEDDDIYITVRTYKSLLIENYEDPWKPDTVQDS